MTAAERLEAVRLLRASLDQLTSIVGSLSDWQANWRPSAAHWSILDNLEHVTVVERAMLARIHDALGQTPESERLERTRGRDARLWRAVTQRIVKVSAPGEFVPSGRFGGWNETLAACVETRGNTIQFAESTQADLRACAFPHFILRDMDGYQWLVFLAAHMGRHISQIREICSDAHFPSTENASSTLPAMPPHAG